MLRQRLTRTLAIGATAVAIGGGAYGTAFATSGSSSTGATAQTAQATTPAATTPAAGAPAAGAPAKQGANARSGPAAGGTVGTVSSVSKSSFTVTTTGGQKMTVKKTSSTTYKKKTSSATASAVTKGKSVLVLGTVNAATITATQVVVQPATGGTETYTPSAVTPFAKGAPSAAKQDGQIPANYTEGQGTIVSGTAATKAATAALAVYPGGVADRVVKLSNGEYEVHNIGVNWPHHIFVSSTYQVLGAY
jgi:cytochrome c-type biogenesis protein CcmE